MKNIKEKQLLVKWAKAMGEEVDVALLEEVERHEQFEKSIIESVRENLFTDLATASKVVPKLKITKPEYPKPPSLEDLERLLEEVKDELVQTETIEETTLTEENIPSTPATDIVSRVVSHITKEVKLEEKADSYQQPDAELSGRSVNDIRKKIKFLEDWVSKISLAGPGGGAGDVITLDHPVKLVTSDYTLTRKDYYVGINSTTTVNISIPDIIGYPGRVIVIKDESGNCSNNPIVVNGTVDNDPGGFILQMDNGGIQMIYREGWRII